MCRDPSSDVRDLVTLQFLDLLLSPIVDRFIGARLSISHLRVSLPSAVDRISRPVPERRYYGHPMNPSTIAYLLYLVRVARVETNPHSSFARSLATAAFPHGSALVFLPHALPLREHFSRSFPMVTGLIRAGLLRAVTSPLRDARRSGGSYKICNRRVARFLPFARRGE